MITCPTCQRRPTKRDGRDHRGHQSYACRPCRRDLTAGSSSIFAGYRWPAEVILAAVRWYLSYPLSIRQVTALLVERGIDVSPRTVVTWAHSFGLQLCWRPGDGVPKGKGLGAPAATWKGRPVPCWRWGRCRPTSRIGQQHRLRGRTFMQGARYSPPSSSARRASPRFLSVIWVWPETEVSPLWSRVSAVTALGETDQTSWAKVTRV